MRLLEQRPDVLSACGANSTAGSPCLPGKCTYRIPRRQGHSFGSPQIWLGCRLAGRERMGSLDFVQAKVDSVTPRWALISASEALLAAKQGRDSRSTDFRGGGSAAVAFQGKTRDESVEEERGPALTVLCVCTPHTVTRCTPW